VTDRPMGFLCLFFCIYFAESPRALTAHVCRESGAALGKDPLCRENLYREAFAESKPLFAKCIGHSTKHGFPVVITYDIHVNPK
jgi:hypothetical protein